MRRLAVGALAFSAAVFAANYLLPLRILYVLATVFAGAGILLIIIKRRGFLRTKIALLAAAVGFAAFGIHSARTELPAKELDGQTLTISGTILDYPSIYSGYCRVEIRLDDELPHLKTILYDNKMELTDAQPGQHISLTAKLKAADTRYGQDYDYYNSKGIYLRATAKSDIIIDGGNTKSIAVFPVVVRRAVAERVEKIFPSDVSPFMRSVMLGDKSALYDDVPNYTALTRAGFMHVAAVSGMHVSFLVALVLFLLGRTRRSAVFCVIIIWCFVLVTGSGPSAVRAGFMQSMLLMAPIVRRESDPVTSLSTVLALVLLQNPHAAASVSLQLSFGAMAGIYLFFGKINSTLLELIPEGRIRKILRNPIGVAACSLAVMIITVPLTAIHFGYVSVLSPLMNVAALWAVSFCFCGGFAACALSVLSNAVGVAAAWVASWAARYVLLAARLVSGVSFAVLYLDNGAAAAWLALTYLLIILAAFTKARAAYRLLCPLAFSVLAFFAMLGLTNWGYSQGAGCVTVLDVGQGQCISVISGERCVVIDCGGGSKQQRAGETAGAYLLNRGYSRIDALLLTHLHSDHANGVLQLMEMVEIDNIIMPADPSDDDGLLEPILKSAANHGTSVGYVSQDTALSAGNIGLELYAPPQDGDTNERCMMICASLGDFDVLVTADAPAAAEKEFIASHTVHDIEVYIVGHHGSKYSSCVELLESIDANTAIISVGYNTYGHPTQETLERLQNCGYNIYRTDQNGSVEIRIGS
jgi:competence protein ComEC